MLRRIFIGIFILFILGSMMGREKTTVPQSQNASNNTGSTVKAGILGGGNAAEKALEKFKENKEAIIKEIKGLAQKGDYQAALDKADKTISGMDPDLKALRDELRPKQAVQQLEKLLAASPKSKKGYEFEEYCKKVTEAYVTVEFYSDSAAYKKERAKWERKWKKLKETRLYAEAKAIPASDPVANEKAYSELLDLNPTNKTYRRKYDHYSKKVALQRQRAASDLEVLNWGWSISHRYVKAEGQVKNISGRKLDYVKALVTWHDKEGNMITSEYSYLEYNPLMPGQRTPFSVMARYNPMMRTARVEFVRRGSAVPAFHKR